jgi:arginine/lysine/ornithine decarboxylase
MLPWEALRREKQGVSLGDSVGKISGMNVIPYPPGVPILLMGELIDRNIVEIISYYVENGADLIGIKDNEIKIIK